MDDDKINNYVDRTGVTSDTSFMLENINTIYEAFKKLDSIKVGLGKLTGLSETIPLIKEANVQITAITEAQKKLGAATDTTTQKQKNLSDSVKENIRQQIEYKNKISDISAELKKLKQDQELLSKVPGNDEAKQEIEDRIQALTEEQLQVRELSKELGKLIGIQVKSGQAIKGTFGELKTELAKLENKREIATPGTKEFDELQVKIKSVRDEIHKIEQEGSDFRRNVGNYAKSLESGFEKVRAEIEKVQTRQASLIQQQKSNPIGFKLGGGEDELTKVTSALNQLNTVAQIGFKVNGNATQQVRALENAYISLATSGNQSVEFLENFKNEIGKVKDDVHDLKESINLAASDTRSLDVLIGGAQAIAGGFGVAQGAAALFGDENEDLQRTLVKLNGVMTILNGLQAIQNELKKKDNIVTIAQINLQKLYAFVVGTSTGATKALRIALAATGVGLLVIGLGFLISKLSELSAKTDQAAKSQETLNKAMDEGDYQQAVKNVNELRNEINLAKEGFLKKEEVVKHYNETIGKTTGQVKSLDEAEQALNKNAAAYIKFTLLKAAANVALDESAKKSVEAAKERIGRVKNIEDDIKNQTGAGEAFGFEIDVEKTQKSLKKASEKKIEQANKDSKDLLDIATDFQNQAAKLAKEFNFKFFDNNDGDKKALEDFAKDLAKVQADITKANFEALKQRRQDEITALENITNDAKKGYNERYAASQQFYDRSLELIDLNLAYEIAAIKKATEEEIRQTQLKLKNPNLTVRQRADLNATLKALGQKFLSEEQVIRTKYASVSIALDSNSEKQRTEIMQSATDRRKKILEDEQKFKEDHQKTIHELDLQKIQSDYDAAAVLLDERFAKGLISEKKYNREKLKLEAARQTATLESEINNTVALIEEQERRFKIDEDELQHKIDIAKAEAELESDPDKKKDRLNNIASAEKELTQIRVSNNDTIAKSSSALNSLLVKLSAIRVDIFKKSNEDIKDDFAETFGKIAEAARQVFDIASAFAGVRAENEKNRLQEQINLLEKKKQKDIEVANATITNAQDKAAAITTIEARAAAQRQQLELKQRQADERKARFDKAASIANIILNTAAAVSKALPNVFFAAVAGALGAAQLAIAIATPIPKFKEGKRVNEYTSNRDNYEGPAFVGDGGKKEMIIRENGEVEITPDTPTLTYIKKKDIILPDAKKVKEVIHDKIVPVPMYRDGKNVHKVESFIIKDTIISPSVNKLHSENNTINDAAKEVYSEKATDSSRHSSATKEQNTFSIIKAITTLPSEHSVNTLYTLNTLNTSPSPINNTVSTITLPGTNKVTDTVHDKVLHDTVQKITEIKNPVTNVNIPAANKETNTFQNKVLHDSVNNITEIKSPVMNITMPDVSRITDKVIAKTQQQLMSVNLNGELEVKQKNETSELKGEIRSMKTDVVNAIKNKKEIHFQSPSVMERVERFKEGNKEYFKMKGL